MPVGILLDHLEGRCFYISERVTDLTGLAAESVMQSGWEQCVHPDDRERVLRQVSSMLHARKPGQAEFRCVLPDGRIRWLLGQSTPEHDLGGHLVGFVWTLTDTTHTHESLRASGSAKKALVSACADYDVMADRDSGRLNLLAPHPRGTTHDAGRGLDFCHPDDRARVEGAMAAALDPRGSGAFAEEFRIRRADTGEVRWIACTCQTSFDGAADGRRPVRFTGITRDVTERRAHETQVQLLSELLLGNEERQEFLLRLSDALRPLNNPLDVQEVSSQLLGQHLGVNRVGYAELESREYVIRREYTRGVAPLAGQGPVGGFAAALHDAFRRGETVVVNDVDRDPRFTDSSGSQAAEDRGVWPGDAAERRAAGGLLGANNATIAPWRRRNRVVRDAAVGPGCGPARAPRCAARA
jgi:PAS domain S-box-containing protein